MSEEEQQRMDVEMSEHTQPRDTFIIDRKQSLKGLDIIDDIFSSDIDNVSRKKPNYRKILLYLKPIFFNVTRGRVDGGGGCVERRNIEREAGDSTAITIRRRRIDTSGEWIWSIVKMIKNSNFTHCDFAFVKSILRDDVGDFLHAHGSDLEDSSLSPEEIEIIVEMCVIAKSSLKIRDDVPIKDDEIFDIPDGTLTGDCGCARLNVDVGFGRISATRSSNKFSFLYPLTSDAVRVYVDRAKKSYSVDECLREIIPRSIDFGRVTNDNPAEASSGYKDTDATHETRVFHRRLAESHRRNILLSYGKLAIVEPKFFPARIEK